VEISIALANRSARIGDSSREIFYHQAFLIIHIEPLEILHMWYSRTLLSMCKLLALSALVLGFAGRVFATDVTLTGPWSTQISSGSSVLSVAKVSNNATTGNSGSLRLELWAFDYPYAGGAQPGYHLADYQLQALNGRTEYKNVVSPAVPTTRPAAGTWYIAMLLTEYNGSSWIMRSYLLASSGQSYVCSTSSCNNVVAPTSVSIGSNRSHFTTHQEDTMSLSARIVASANEGTLTDIFISVSLADQTYYLDPALEWTPTEVAALTHFSLTDLVAPDFYSIATQSLPAGNYTFHVGLAASDTPATALRAYIAQGSTDVVYDDFPTITFPPVNIPNATVGLPIPPFSFSGMPRTHPPSQASLHYHFQLGTFGGFPPIGIILAPDGTLSGTPKVAGSANFAVCAVDESGSFGGSARSGCRQVVMNVLPAAPTTTPPPTTTTSLFANWTCNGSTACASVMGGTLGSTGLFCSVSDCNAWGQKTIPGGYSCSTTASLANPRVAQSYANGQCAVNGVDF
jgi:hypothetical protein